VLAGGAADWLAAGAQVPKRRTPPGLEAINAPKRAQSAPRRWTPAV